jgi:hypothetical protein
LVAVGANEYAVDGNNKTPLQRSFEALGTFETAILLEFAPQLGACMCCEDITLYHGKMRGKKEAEEKYFAEYQELFPFPDSGITEENFKAYFTERVKASETNAVASKPNRLCT